MNADAWPVQLWPEAGPFPAIGSTAGNGPIVIGVSTPETTIRHVARERLRKALREALGALFQRPSESIELISQPGRPVRAELEGRGIGISLSHEPGLSLAAICPDGPVGIDLMRLEQRPDWMPDWESVAHSYLGSQAAERIALTSSERRAQAFAREWTRFEAALKCHGLALSEWDTAVGQALAQCQFARLDLPGGYVGHIATLAP